MTPEDFIYQQAFKKFMALGYTDRDAGYVAADAQRRFATRGGKAVDVIEKAVIEGKRLYKAKTTRAR